MTTTTFWVFRLMPAPMRSSAPIGSWLVGIIPTSRETTARSRSSKPPAPTKSLQTRGSAARTMPSDSRPARLPGPGRGNWFADEVAIDFPSVSDLLDRMRHSFFGANALEELSAEIVLSPLEAFTGTTIPIGIPVRQTCNDCGGRGETWEEWCGHCGGCGDVRSFHDVELRVPAGVRAGERFRFSVMPPGAPITRVDILISIRASQ